jgi:hypothetical protein
MKKLTIFLFTVLVSACLMTASAQTTATTPNRNFNSFLRLVRIAPNKWVLQVDSAGLGTGSDFHNLATEDLVNRLISIPDTTVIKTPLKQRTTVINGNTYPTIELDLVSSADTGAVTPAMKTLWDGAAAKKVTNVAVTGTTTKTITITFNDATTITATFTDNDSGASGVPDGDKTDINVTGSGTIWTIKNNAVVTAKINDGAVNSAKIADGTVALTDLSATGTKDATTFLRGDNTFAVPAGGGSTPLTTGTITNQTSFVINLSSYNYKHIKIKLYAIKTTVTADNIYFQTSSDNSNYAGTYVSGGGFPAQLTMIGNINNLHSNTVILNIYSRAQTIDWPNFTWDGIFQDMGSNWPRASAGGTKAVNQAVNYVKIFSEGGFTTGTFSLNYEVWGE